jgi:predicted nucleic acid-binding protein
MSSTVVADAGPLHYLVLIDCGEALGTLFDRVLVPIAVRDELLHPRAPQKVKDWIVSVHPWLEIRPVAHPRPVHGLHKGETEAIQLALERRADAVLMDDRDGRDAARRLGIPTIFTIAILEIAAEKELIDLPVAISKIKQTSFFVSPEILDAALERDKERRNKKA